MKGFTGSLGCLSAVLASWLVLASSAQAQLRQVYPASAAQEGDVMVTVWPGSGTNIDFSGLGESIYRVWLDDPSRITVDTDNDLRDGGGAQIIHLRRIEGVEFEGLPATPQTLLSVATVNQNRQTRLYQFPVTYSVGIPSYSTIALTLPPPDPTPIARIQLPERLVGDVSLETIRTGLTAAIREGLIEANGPLARRVRAFIALVNGGQEPNEAADEAVINLSVIHELAERGIAEDALSHDRRRLLERIRSGNHTQVESINASDLPEMRDVILTPFE